MSNNSTMNTIEDFVTKEAVYVFIDRYNGDVTAPMVLGRFHLPPDLRTDVETIIDLS